MIRFNKDTMKPAPGERKTKRDLKTLASFIQIYCDGHHKSADRTTPTLKAHDLDSIAARPVKLCTDCQKLLAHAFTMRTHCDLDPKPSCKNCTEHCYAPKYRNRIRTVMRYSGKRLLLQGRLDYIWHLLL